MAEVAKILYIKADQNVELSSRIVKLKDVITMECSKQEIVSRLNKVELFRIPEQGKQRTVISILKIIECIHKEYPDLEIQNLGSADVILTYEPESSRNKVREWIKIGLVTTISFVGAAFAIMTFNNDSGITTLFGDIFEMFMGYPKQGFSVLEFTYSIGIVVGILLFFNHFGKRKFTVDPTPIEIEMRLYEKDIQDTLIEDYARKGKEIDVGQSVDHGDHWS